MRHVPWPALLTAALFASGCAGKDAGGDDTVATSTTNGLPEGSSTWTGAMEVGEYNFLLDLSLVNTAGELAATVTFSDDPEAPAGYGTGTFTATGTHEPGTGLLALAPEDWVDEPDIASELLGALAIYDPDERTITGTVQDYASGNDNTLLGGALTATWVSGDGAPSAIGPGETELSTGEHTLSGTLQCTGPVREVEGALSYDGSGRVEGWMIIGDTGVDSPLGTFEFTGVHNPSTGGLTLVPGLWRDIVSSALTFFVDGTYDPATAAYTGDQRTNTNACPPATWDAVIE